MAPRRRPQGAYGCATCGNGFTTKVELSRHMTSCYQKATNPVVFCEVCKWNFNDWHEIELHKAQTGHGMSNFTYENCNERFVSQKAIDDHKALPTSKGYIDLDKPKQNESPTIHSYNVTTHDSEGSTNVGDSAVQCKDCKRKFMSQGSYNNHFLSCEPFLSVLEASHDRRQAILPVTKLRFPPVSSEATITSKPKAPVSKFTLPQKVISKTEESDQLQQHQASSASSAPPADTRMHICNAHGCGKTFRSEAGLAQHKKDIHGIGGQKLEMVGRDSWMLNQQDRARLKQAGLLKEPSGPARGHGNNNASARAPPLTARQANVPLRSSASAAQNPMPVTQPAVVLVSTDIGSVADMEQAKQFQSRALRLLIQSDIFIYPNGKILVGGIAWTRIHVTKQPGVVGALDTMCHLPKVLQGEYLPAPKAFLDEHNVTYDITDFTTCPFRDLGKPGLGVVVLSCSKVFLAGGRQEVVKIAAIDLTTCGILMNHLVCTDPHAHVTDWRSSATGLSSWQDMEAARQAGYKIFKGWSAARKALQKYADSGTIIVGHNLRADLDVLRIEHGRAVDIVKVVEKAANGPLSKAQLSLDSLCRDCITKTLASDARYGRDCLVDAFAIREFALWAIKNEENLKNIAKEKSSDYQRIFPSTDGVKST